MYLYYLIGWKIDACQEMENVKQLEKDKCFILALDGDVDFDPPALDLVLNRLLRNDDVAACCGQIHPKGDGYLVAYQRKRLKSRFSMIISPYIKFDCTVFQSATYYLL